MVRHNAGILEEKTSVDEHLILRKAAAYGTVDMLWQYGCQYPDRYLLGTKAGKGYFNNEWMGNDVTAMIYPVFLAVLAYWLALNVFLKGHDKDYTDTKAYDDQMKKEDSFEICHTVFKGITGWTAGYYFAESQEWGVGATAAAVGVGAALPGLIITLGYQTWKGRLNTDKAKNAGVTAFATFIAGAIWLGNSLLPEFIGGNEFSKEILRSFVAPALTLLTTAACVGLVLYREEKQSMTLGNRASSIGR
jgi:hypothetical protein